jgi:nicotinamide-nucleotide amidase
MAETQRAGSAGAFGVAFLEFFAMRPLYGHSVLRVRSTLRRVKAEIIAIGTEILLGEIIDTNSAYIAQRLPELGIDLNYKSVVGDNMDRIVETFNRAWNRSDIIICTGGLGPTADDMTREGIAKLLGETPFVDAELEKRLRAWFDGRGYLMPESNIKQAWLIESCRAIDNPRGTAPGWWVERDGKSIICMPGVPPEMERMWLKEVQPELEKRSDGQVLVTRTIKTVGIGEGTVDEMAKHLYDSPGIGIGTYARADGVHLRIGAKANTREEAWEKIKPIEEEMNRVFGTAIWGARRRLDGGLRRGPDARAPDYPGGDGIVHGRPVFEHAYRRSRCERVLPRWVHHLFESAED